MAGLRVLFVINKKIPSGDYRLAYGASTKRCSVTYAMPGRPPGLPEERYVQMGVGEGFNLGQLFHLAGHFFYLIKHRSGYDLVHYYSTLLILFGPVFAYLSGLPSVITVTGFGRTFSSTKTEYQILRRVYWLLFSVSLRISRAALFQNVSDMKLVSDLFPQYKSKVKYIGSAVDAPAVTGKDYHAQVLVVLAVARLMPDKGIRDFLEVASSLGSDHLRFRLVGPRSIGYDALFRSVMDAHQRGVITYLGELEYAQLMVEYRKAHILLFPSYAEGMARVMLEAGYARLCPIAYDIPANRDLISEGRGFLVPLKNIDRIIELIKDLYLDRDRLMHTSENYQKWILENFNLDNFVHRLDCILNDAVL